MVFKWVINEGINILILYKLLNTKLDAGCLSLTISLLSNSIAFKISDN